MVNGFSLVNEIQFPYDLGALLPFLEMLETILSFFPKANAKTNSLLMIQFKYHVLYFYRVQYWIERIQRFYSKQLLVLSVTEATPLETVYVL